MLYIALGILISIALIIKPILLLMLCVLLGIIFIGVALPNLFIWLALMSVIFSPQCVLIEKMYGIELDSFQKAFILLALLIYFLVYGARWKDTQPIYVYLIMLLFTFILSSWHFNLELYQPFKTFAGLVLGWLLFCIKWDSKFKNKYLLSITLMPILSVFIGIIFNFMDLYPLYIIEYTGAFRLQGLSMPPHLAMLAAVGFSVAIIQAAENKKLYLLIAIINFTILVATGTRGALIFCLLVGILYVLNQLKNVLYGKVFSLISLIIFILIVSVVAHAYLPQMQARIMNNSFEDSSFNSSGRLEAWKFFFSEALVNPWFGRGLGSSTAANDGELNSSFRVPHNEYLRIFFDGGLVGLLLVLSSYYIVFKSLLKHIEPMKKLYLTAFLLGFALYSFVDNTLSTPQFQIPFFWYLGILKSKK